MKNVLFSTGQRVFQKVLEWLQESKEDSLRERQTDISDFGIFDEELFTLLTGTVTFTSGSAAVTGTGTAFLSQLKEGDVITDSDGSVRGTVDSITDDSNLTLTSNWTGSTASVITANRIDPNFNIVIGDNDNPPVTHSINVRSGLAYDVNNERIEITTPLVAYDPAAPSTTSPDGKGSTVPTPISTGSQNITLTANSVNYIWIEYLATIDTSDFTLHKITNTFQYYKQTDGYQILLTTTNTAPSASSILLGTVDLTGGGVVSPTTISLAGRDFFGLDATHIRAKVAKQNRTDVPDTYTYEQEVSLSDHVKAIGTGTVSPANPHGLAPLDIGLNTAEILENHQKFMHSNGIVGDSASTTSSLFVEVVTQSPGDDFIRVHPLDPDELAHINGITISNADIPSQVNLLFSSVTDATDTYYVFLNKNTKTVQRSNVDPSGDVTKLPLASFLWTADAGGPGDGDITGLTDLRVFGNIANREIQDGAVTSEKLGGRILLPDGSTSEPSYSFISEDDTGMYLAGTNDLRFSVNATDFLSLNTSGVTLTSGQHLGPDGSAASPLYSFVSDVDTGIYLSSVGNLGLTVGGSQRLNLSTTSISPLVRLTNVDGTATEPAYSFASDDNSGLFSQGADSIGVAVGGSEVARIGTGGLTLLTGSQLVSPLGSVGSPSYTFSTDEDTGLFGLGSGVSAFSSNGADALRISSAQTLGVVGTVSLPGYSFIDDPNTGIYSSSADTLDFSTGGANRMSIDSTAVTSTVSYEAPDSGYRFSGESTMGLRRNSSSVMDLVIGNNPIIRIDDNAQEVVFDGFSYDLRFDPNSGASRFQFRSGSGINMHNIFDTLIASIGSTTSPDNRWGVLIQPSNQFALQIRASDGNINKPLQAMFNASQISADNVTGDGTIYQVPFGSERLDVGGNFNNSTGVFTAPITGKYLLCTAVHFFDTASASSEDLFITIVTSNKSYDNAKRGIGTLGGFWFGSSLELSVVADMDAGDTAHVTAQATNGSKTVEINTRSFFTGMLLG